LPEKAIKKKTDTKFHKDTFDKTTAERRQKVIEVAISEFSANGYNATNINDIARKSGISIGAMYSYFASKEDLFLAIVNNAYILLETTLKAVSNKSSDIFEIFEGMLAASREYAIKYPELHQIYLDMTTQALSKMAGRLSTQIEPITVHLYKDILKQAKSEGKIRQDIDEELTAFCIDNLFVMYQFSFSADYYKERMKIFLGEEKLGDIHASEQKIMTFIRKALTD
jgi:TetR/AcrR family transcriptional regulator